jgi:HEAT repeat protein
MMNMPAQLRLAMEAECAGAVEEIVDAHRQDDLTVLRAMLTADADVPPAFRNTAVQILGRWQDTQSVAAIRELITDFGERERANAVDALGRIGGPDAETVVLDAAEDTSPDVRRFAAYALARLGSERARGVLRTLAVEDPAEPVRAAASRGLRDER